MTDWTGTFTVWLFTRELQARARREGWALFDSSERGLEVERCDDVYEGGPAEPLANDDVAIELAIAAGVPCNTDGTIFDWVDVEYEEEA